MSPPDRWQNWAGNQERHGIEVIDVAGEAELCAAVATATADGKRIRPIGSGHSFTDIGAPVQQQLMLRDYHGIARLDATGLATVRAGTTLRQLNADLAAQGRALTNLGDIDAQTVTGAISTGTHGTGRQFGGLATQVRGLSLVQPDGRVLRCSATEHPDIFEHARVGLGALGIISTVTLQTEPLFALNAQEAPMGMDEVLRRLDELVEETDHFEFYWFPHTRRTLTKRNTRVPIESGRASLGLAPLGLAPLSRARAWWDDEFLANTAFGALVEVGRRVPATIRPINAVAARALGARSFTDHSYRVFTSARRVRFVEMEYAMPRAALPEVLTALDAAIEARRWRIAFPVEVRFAAADDIPLSTAYGRESAYLAIHVPAGVAHTEYFRSLAEIVAPFGGRPHWGKLHYLDAARLRELYPRFDEFVALRDRLDPDRVFSNPYLERVLGA